MNLLKSTMMEIIEKEFMYLCRLKRKAIKKGCSTDLVYRLAEEANSVMGFIDYPERVFTVGTVYDFKFAFKGCNW